jgi:hypothetical protein
MKATVSQAKSAEETTPTSVVGMTTVLVDMPTPTTTLLLFAQVPTTIVKASRTMSGAKESTIIVAAKGMVADKPPAVTPRFTRSTAPRNITKTTLPAVNNKAPKGGKRNAKRGSVTSQVFISNIGIKKIGLCVLIEISLGFKNFLSLFKSFSLNKDFLNFQTKLILFPRFYKFIK